LIGCLVGGASVVLASKLRSIGSYWARYCWGFLYTFIWTFGLMPLFGHQLFPIPQNAGPYAGLGAAIGTASCIWAGLIIGGPAQILIARLHLFGQTAEPVRAVRQLGCNRQH
jgi:hypothetical protein